MAGVGGESAEARAPPAKVGCRGGRGSVDRIAASCPRWTGDWEARCCGAGGSVLRQPVEHRLQKEFTGLDGVTWESACRHQINPRLHRVRDSLMMANSASSFEEDQQKHLMTLTLMSLHKVRVVEPQES